MFSKEDYELSLEKQLRMRMIDDDIDNCDDIEVLRNSLKSTASMLATYQQLLSVAVTKHMEQEIAQLTRSCND